MPERINQQGAPGTAAPSMQLRVRPVTSFFFIISLWACCWHALYGGFLHSFFAGPLLSQHKAGMH
jgi:hypothetical protein